MESSSRLAPLASTDSGRAGHVPSRPFVRYGASWRWAGWIAIGVLAIVLVIAFSRGFQADSVAETVSANIAVVGVLAGIAIKHQSERRLQHEHDDNEERLRLDAAMRAGSLLGGTDETPANPAAAASALLALTQLGRVDLAVAILADLWPVDRTPANANAWTCGDEPRENDDDARLADHDGGLPAYKETGILVIDAALKSTDANAQLVAAGILCRHARQLDVCDPLHWPSAIDNWNKEWPAEAKVLIADALVTMGMCLTTENALSVVAVRLWRMWKAEATPSHEEISHAESCFGLLLQGLRPAIKRLPYDQLVLSGVMIPKQQFLAETGCISSRSAPNDLLTKLAKNRKCKLRKWASECTTRSSEPGTFGAAA